MLRWCVHKRTRAILRQRPVTDSPPTTGKAENRKARYQGDYMAREAFRRTWRDTLPRARTTRSWSASLRSRQTPDRYSPQMSARADRDMLTRTRRTRFRRTGRERLGPRRQRRSGRCSPTSRQACDRGEHAHIRSIARRDLQSTPKNVVGLTPPWLSRFSARSSDQLANRVGANFLI